MIKAVFFDMDGTLVSYPEGEIPLSAKNAIAELRKKGILVFMATGRHRVELETMNFLDGVTFDGFAALNGQYCYTKDTALLCRSLAAEDVSAFLEFIEETPIPCAFEEEDRIYINFATEDFRKAMAAIATDLPPVVDMKSAATRRILQIIPYCDEKTIAAFIEKMPSSRAVRWSPDFVDIIPKDGGKTEGIASILSHFGIGWENVIAFGDGLNDIEMLKAAAISVAMGNGHPKVKECASYITADANKDGVALALAHFGLI